jgi:smad nuclear-interacting protein 1
MHIQRQSAYLVGRDKTIVDIPVDHPSCSKQHAVIQCTPTLPLAHIQVLML